MARQLSLFADVPLIDVSPCVTSHGGDAVVADVFARLELAKVVP